MDSMRGYIKLLCLLGMLLVASIVGAGNTNAEPKFKSKQGMQFTLNPTLALSVSGYLTIPDLVSGTNVDSNEITVTVDTNAISGYFLFASVGDSEIDTDLVNTSNSNYAFSSLIIDTELASMANANDNTWGYAFKINNGNYSNYTGFGQPAGAGEIICPEPNPNSDPFTEVPVCYANGFLGSPGIIDTNTPADSTIVTFKIGAKASNSQPAGTYTNTINFYAVSRPLPEDKTIDDLQYMQDFATLTNAEKTTVLASMAEDTEYQLQDSRDGKWYYIAKLKDGNVWMTQNLDHDIVTTTDFYTPDNTDVPDYWTASTATYATGTTTWNESNTTPESYDPGNYCWSGGTNNDTLADCGTSLGEPNHYHLGNYYNWTAAVAMEDSSNYETDGEIMDQSICPAGWTLPTAGPETGSGSYENLLTGYGYSDYEMTNPYIWEDPLYFPLSGYWHGDLYGLGGVGNYWSSVVYDSGSAYYLHFDSFSYVYPDYNVYRDSGYSVRCVAR